MPHTKPIPPYSPHPRTRFAAHISFAAVALLALSLAILSATAPGERPLSATLSELSTHLFRHPDADIPTAAKSVDGVQPSPYPEFPSALSTVSTELAPPFPHITRTVHVLVPDAATAKLLLTRFYHMRCHLLAHFPAVQVSALPFFDPDTTPDPHAADVALVAWASSASRTPRRIRRLRAWRAQHPVALLGFLDLTPDASLTRLYRFSPSSSSYYSRVGNPQRAPSFNETQTKFVPDFVLRPATADKPLLPPASEPACEARVRAVASSFRGCACSATRLASSQRRVLWAATATDPSLSLRARMYRNLWLRWRGLTPTTGAQLGETLREARLALLACGEVNLVPAALNAGAVPIVALCGGPGVPARLAVGVVETRDERAAAREARRLAWSPRRVDELQRVGARAWREFVADDAERVLHTVAKADRMRIAEGRPSGRRLRTARSGRTGALRRT